jgi:hypothetical protein
MIAIWRSADIVNRGLILTVVLMLAFISLELDSILGERQVENLQAAEKTTPPSDEFAGVVSSNDFPAVGSFSAILLRPLFEDTRRPVQTQVAGADNSSAAALKQKWRLSGIIIDINNIAIMEGNRSTETLSLTQGQSLDGWRVQEIEAKAVVLSRSGELLRFPLYEDDPISAPTTRSRNAQRWKPPD